MKNITITLNFDHYITRFFTDYRKDYIYNAICDLELDEYVDAYSSKARKLVSKDKLLKDALNSLELHTSIELFMNRFMTKALKNDDEGYWLTDIYEIIETWATKYLLNDTTFVAAAKELYKIEEQKTRKKSLKDAILQVESFGYTISKKKK